MYSSGLLRICFVLPGRRQRNCMKPKRQLTKFQESCETAVRSALASAGAVIVGRELLGEGETYIRASVGGSDLMMYIYEDEAQFHTGSGLAGLYESQDYSSSAELQAAFVSDVITALGERPAAIG